MNKTYHYEGPIQLGSTVAHHCGAAGLVTTKGVPWVRLVGRSEDGIDTLSVYEENRLLWTWEAPSTTAGRKQIGKALLYALREKQDISTDMAWGCLVGVRPSKLVHRYLDEGHTATEAVAMLQADYDVRADKAQDLVSIVTYQRSLWQDETQNDRVISLYGGIPFCQTQCSYCSFPFGLWPTFKEKEAFLKAFLQDAVHMRDIIDHHHLTVQSAYMGGGTPTVLDDASFAQALQGLASCVIPGNEFTVEAGRPDSVTTEKLRVMASLGVTRMSINPQTMQDDILRYIGRGHGAKDIEELYRKVRREWDFQINMDFIAGLPGQTVAHMLYNIEYVMQAMPHNVTIHTLAIKKGSPLYQQEQRLLPEEAAVQEMTALAKERLLAAGYIPYYVYRQQYMTGQLENMGFTLPGYACMYNIQSMEERQSILAIGPGSTSKWMRAPAFRQEKQYMPKDVPTYIDTLSTLRDKREQISRAFWKDEE